MIVNKNGVFIDTHVRYRTISDNLSKQEYKFLLTTTLTISVTGHRPTRFCFGYNEEDPLCQKLKECLLEQFRILHDEKFVRTFFVGGALGVDMWAGEQLLTLRAQTGYEDIKIIVVIPFIGYDSKWPDQSKHRLKKLIQNANDSIVISHSADVSSYKKRNYYMVDHAEYLIGVFDNQKKLRSGTAQTVNYALRNGKAITLIHPDTMEITTPTT